MIYLDIDLDYFVKPVFKSSVNEIRMYKGEKCEISNMHDFYNVLISKIKIPEDKHIFTNHKKSYLYWWIKRYTDCILIHIDAHSDLYRNKQKDLTLLSDLDMNCDDYIWYAVREGFIKEIYWVCPDELLDFNDKNIAYKMFGDKIIKNVNCENTKIDIEFDVVNRFGRGIPLKLHILGIDNLPSFEEEPCMLTFATSPEFIPMAADILLDNVKLLFGFDAHTIDLLKIQHSTMPEE